jgi:hypothetical protein
MESRGVVYRVGALSTGAAIGVGAVAGLVLGILVSVATDLPLARKLDFSLAPSAAGSSVVKRPSNVPEP